MFVFVAGFFGDLEWNNQPNWEIATYGTPAEKEQYQPHVAVQCYPFE